MFVSEIHGSIERIRSLEINRRPLGEGGGDPAAPSRPVGGVPNVPNSGAGEAGGEVGAALPGGEHVPVPEEARDLLQHAARAAS